MKIEELTLLLYISTVNTSEKQSFKFIHRVFGKRTAKSLVEKGFIAEYESNVYVMTSYGAGIPKGLDELSGYFARFGNCG